MTLDIMTAIPKPVPIQGAFFEGTYESFEKVSKWIQSFPSEKIPTADVSIWDANHEEFYILTLEGRMRVSDGDVVIRGLAGEFYPCKPLIYGRKYDVVKVSEFKCD